MLDRKSETFLFVKPKFVRITQQSKQPNANGLVGSKQEIRTLRSGIQIMSNEVKKIDSNLEAHSISIELIWNSDNNSIEEIEDHYDTLREHLPENEADGPSIFGRRVQTEIRNAMPCG